MARFAEQTQVSVESSKAEIERTLMRYGATGFISGWHGSHAMIAFEIKDRRLRFLLPLPDRNAKEFWRTPARHHQRTPEEAYKAWEQSCRQRWRALALAIKAKLEAVQSGIATFEEEFLAYFQLPDGSTIGERTVPQIAAIYQTGRMPPLLPGPVQ